MSATVKKLIFVADDLERAITWPCKIELPQDGGTTEARQLDCSFKVPSPERIDQYYRDLGKAVSEGADNASLALLDEFVVAFPTLLTAVGTPADFAQALALFKRQQFVVLGIVRGLLDMSAGRVAKN